VGMTRFRYPFGARERSNTRELRNDVILDAWGDDSLWRVSTLLEKLTKKLFIRGGGSEGDGHYRH